MRLEIRFYLKHKVIGTASYNWIWAWGASRTQTHRRGTRHHLVRLHLALLTTLRRNIQLISYKQYRARPPPLLIQFNPLKARYSENFYFKIPAYLPIPNKRPKSCNCIKADKTYACVEGLQSREPSKKPLFQGILPQKWDIDRLNKRTTKPRAVKRWLDSTKCQVTTRNRFKT